MNLNKFEPVVIRGVGALVVFLLLSAPYLYFSGAPARVHFLSLFCLALGVVPSVYMMAKRNRNIRQWFLSAVFVFISLVVWDATNQFVVKKLEPFSILRTVPWAYLLGFVLLSIVVASSAEAIRWVASQTTYTNKKERVK